jgi:hypothetical protein
MMEKVFLHIRDDELIRLCFEELTDEELKRDCWITERPFYWNIESFIMEFNEEKEEE